MDDAPIVEAEGLVKRYGSVTALDGVDLEVRRGEVFGLIGPNGAGKTTFIRAVVGALRPTSGRLEVIGLDPLADRWRLRSRIGYMPQEPALYPDLSARRNVAFFCAAHIRGPDGSEVERALSLIGLEDRADDPVRTLSGGMQQRVSLACALVHDPEILILDEPTAGVDPELRATFWETFRRMAGAGTTVIVSTHQMGEALECDRVALLRDGLVLAAEQPASLLRSHKATAHVWRRGVETTFELDDYPAQLPGLVDPEVDRMEIELEPLDHVVLGIIEKGRRT
jgi:ABC-2 type transport system ATP-binding protein